MFLLGDSSATSGQHDRITDFVSGTDDIDLSGFDAISSTGSYDQFKFIATAAFNGAAGELNYFYNSSTGVTTLQGDTNGDRVADFAIDLTGNVAISLADLIGPYSLLVTIESIGATTLTQVGSNYYLYANGTSSGPSLKYAGTTFLAGQSVAGCRSAWRRRRAVIRSPGSLQAPTSTRSGAPTTTATTPCKLLGCFGGSDVLQ